MSETSAHLKAVDEHLARSRELRAEMRRCGEGVVRNLRAAAAVLRERERAERGARA